MCWVTRREDSLVAGQEAYLSCKMFRLTIAKLCRFRLAEYRQRKAHADSQKKQKKKKKKKPGEDSEAESQGRVEVEPDQFLGGEGEREVKGERQDEGSEEKPTTEFTFTKTLKSGETVRHDQTYKIEPESEVSTTAEDYSSEVNGCLHEMTESLMMPSQDFIWEEVDALQQPTEGRTVQDMEDALAVKNQALEELSRELEEMRSAFGADGVQQLQDFEAALKQRDGIITQLTSNLQQAREEKDEITKEFLALTEQSQRLQIQFQQLQAGETLRNTSHSSTAADLLQARQQLVQYQQQLEEMNAEVKGHQETSGKQLQLISHLQQKLSELELSGRRSEESFAERIKEKELLIAEQEKVILSREQSQRQAEEEFAQTIEDKNLLISQQTATIKEHEQSMMLLRQEVVHAGRTRDEKIIQDSDDKDIIIAEKERVISERDTDLIRLKDELENAKKHLHELRLQVALKESELKKCLTELGSTKSELTTCKSEMESYKLELEKEQKELESCKGELANSRQRERMSSSEIMLLMGTVEDLQKRCHQGSVSETDAFQKMQEETTRKLELLRAELDEMYGQQIVQMKQELNLQHVARMQQMTEQHQAEIELLKAQHQSSNLSKGEVEALNARIRELQFILQQSEATYDETRRELSQVAQEKSKLQSKVESLVGDLNAARHQVEQVSTRLASQETTQQLQETIQALRDELSAAQEAAVEAETKHESEITNYKIKLEMLEREKDAVLDRMAESQEAELERLRTQLLFSHEEELTNLREDLQRESFLNAENLLNEAAVRHEKALDELRVGHAQQLELLQKEKTSYAAERNDLLRKIHGLEEDLKLALQSSKTEELVLQLQELQVELKELRKGAQDRVRMQNQIQSLLKQTEVLENQKKEKEQKLKEHEDQKETLFQSNNALRDKIETLTAQNNQFQRQVDELRENIEKQKSTFSFAEKNFEVNFQELKEEYASLAEAKTQLEERTLREALEFEVKIARLQSDIRELEERRGDVKMERDLMEKLNVTLNEKKSQADRLSEVTERLMVTETRVRQLDEDLIKARQKNSEVIAKNESLLKELEKAQEISSKQKKLLQKEEQTVEAVSPSEDHRRQIQSLQQEIKALTARLGAAEAERDGALRTLELHRLSHTPSPAAAHSSGEGPIEGRSSPHKPASSGSSRRKRRQRSKQERRGGSTASEERQREEEERAKSAAEEEMLPQTQSRVMSCSPESAGKEDSATGYQGDGGKGYINKAVSGQGMGCHTECAEEEEETSEHEECRLEMEAQRISLSQIHAAQLELLQEETDASLDLRLPHLREQSGLGGRKKSKHMIEAVSEECSEIILSFQKIFGKEFLESVNTADLSLISEERPTTSESSSIVQEARELYTNLCQVREKIKHEHDRLSQLQDLLRSDVNKTSELQVAYDELKINSEKQLSDLNAQLATMSLPSSRDVGEQARESDSMTVELQRLKAEAQVKQLRLEESHRQEMERLRAHYQQQAADTEERYATELFVLQQRLQEATGAQTYYSLSSTPEIDCEGTEEPKERSEKDVSERDEGVRRSARPSSLTPQLQALKKALHHKYDQEVAALKEQHSIELRRLREEREHWGGRGERKLDRNGVNGAGSSTESLGAAGQEDRLQQERVEEEVAKAIVQMSVEFAQQTELARIRRQAGQTNSSMQTQMDDEDVDGEMEEQTPRASPPAGVWLGEPEREKLEREVEERNAEIRKLKEELQKTELEQALKKKDDGEEQDEEEEEDSPHTTVDEELKISRQDDGESSDKETERKLLSEANRKLSQVLVDVLKTTAAAEETLGLHMQRLCEGSAGVQPTESNTQTQTYQSDNPETRQSRKVGADIRFWSGKLEAEEVLDIRHEMMDRLLLGAESQLESEEYFLGISRRLQAAVEKMLMTITDTTNQLDHARMTQTELMRESFRHNQEITELLQKQEELQERAMEEARAREQLALELHRAEGLIDGYTGERAALEERLRQKEELQLSLEQELQVTTSRLHELEQERLQMQEERELLSRQQDAMREEAGPRELCLVEAAMVAAPEADLLEETEKLMKEKVEVQRQAEKENTDLLKQVKQLEDELEEQVNRVIELEHSQTMETGDLRQQIQALEKQLEKNKKFLDEQAVDREHERDVFQQEIQKLEQQLKNPQKLQLGSEQRNQEVQQLSAQLKEKADCCSELLLGSEQLRRELGERDEEIEKLESRIHELEQALLASAESQEKVEPKKQHASITETKHATLEAQLQTEREALERKEKEICNLEEQLEQFREELENKSEEVQQLHMQLEIQRKEISSQQQFLEMRDRMLQVMEERDREIALLNEQISKHQHMETALDNKEMDAKDELIKELEFQVEYLRSEQVRLKTDREEEVDQLNAVIEKLQQELASIEQKQPEEEGEAKEELESGGCVATKEEFDEMKQRMDMATKELDTLRAEHGKLLETYLRLKQSAEALAESESLGGAESELEEALREKTAGLVVLQAEVQALEQSAASRVEELELRIRELEVLVEEKDSEVERCQVLVEETQSHADDLKQKVSTLEGNLREKVAEALVSQATLEAFQQQHRTEASKQEAQSRPAAEVAYQFGDFGIPQMDFSSLGPARQAPRGKVALLTQKLQDLEVGLSGMQKDQELQKQLLSSSEEEVQEYERRLAVLMELLSEMKAGPQQRAAPSNEVSSSTEQPGVSALLQELQEVREEASATEEQLRSLQDICSRLKQELHEKTATVEKLQDQLDTTSTAAGEESKTSELEERLAEAQTEAASAKEELSSCRESLDKLQELLQEREMTIAHLKGELFQVKAAEDGANMTDLLHELQEAKREAASTKEELNVSLEHQVKLQEDIQTHKISLSKLNEELQETRSRMNATKEELTKYQQQNEKLQDEIRGREVLLSELKQELQETRKEEKVCEVSVSEEVQDATKEELSKRQQHNEELRVQEVSQELQELSSSGDASNEELRGCRRQNKELLEEISRLKAELQEMRTTAVASKEEQHDEEDHQEVRVCEVSPDMRGADATKEELAKYQQQNEKLQEDIQSLEVLLSELKEELQQMRKSADASNQELAKYQQRNEELLEEVRVREVSLSELKEKLQEMERTESKGEQNNEEPHDVSVSGELPDMRSADATKEEQTKYQQHNEKLQDEIQTHKVSLSKLNEELQEMRSKMGTTEEELTKYQQQNEKLQNEIQCREALLSELKEELKQMRRNADASKQELSKYQQQNEELEEEVRIREICISELKEEQQKSKTSVASEGEQRNEDLHQELRVHEASVSEELLETRRSADATKEEMTKYHEKLQEEIQSREESLSKVREELQEMTSNMDAANEELRRSRQHNEELLEEITKLNAELQEALMRASESVPPSPQPPLSVSSSTTQPKRKGAKQPAAKGGSAKEKPSLSRKNSATHKTPSLQPNSSSDQQPDATTNSFTQTEPLQMSDLSQSAAKEQIEDVIGEFQEKIVQMQELHAAEILDMEARHISESENLRRDTRALEDECKGLKAVIDKLCSTEAPPLRPDRPAPQFKDGYTSDSSSDYSQRTGFDVPSLQPEFRSTPEGARRETDDPLPDRIKTLLREVHQEGMQVLSLSELPLSEGEPGGQFNTDGWAKERDALLATVQSLKGLITQMQTHSQSQTSRGVADWRAELLDAVRQVFMRERSVLKSALYSQLDRLDTSDAIVHLNHLERLLAEQDAHHREAMGSLQVAERSSLLSEVQQLRGQLEQLHQSGLPGLSSAAEGNMEERRGRAADGAAETDGLILEEMKAELSQTKLELETTLMVQQKRLKELDTLRVEVSQKAAELDALNEELMQERKRSRDLQWAAEKERCRSGRDEESKREELEDLQLALDEQKALADQLTQTLQQERQASSQVSQQAEQDDLVLQTRLQELQVHLETERAKAQEMSAALGRERELRAGGRSGEEGGGHDGREGEEQESLLEKLQRELDDKHTQVVHLLSQVEAQRLEVVRKEEELTLANQKSRRDQDGLQEARAELDRLKVRMSEVKQQLEEEQQKRKSLEEEKERVEENGAQQAVWHSEPTNRTKDWVLHQKSENAQSANASPCMEGSPADAPSGPHHGPWRTVDKIVGKLHLVSSKIRSMASKTADRSTVEIDGEELSWIQSSVDEVISLLQQSPGLPFIPESVSLLAGGSSSSSNSLTERLLRQNAELTGFVSRLTEEKNDLRNLTLRLEEELRRYRQAGAGSAGHPSRRGVSKADSAAMLLSQERDTWTREKLRLEKALHLSQSQVARLTGEIRSDALREITGPDADNSALKVRKRMYGKYLRSESFRKALIYQKKYLLLLLGGFQECEEATLSLLSKMGGRPSLSSLELFSQRRQGLSRFRSAVRVSIALSRMRFLVKRWHKATGMSSTASCNISKNGTGSDVRDSPYLHPGSVDMYRDRGAGGGVSSSRGRSGRESPRSGVSSSHHRFHTAGDHGALTCSHLQSYDPDRALTDYISRLEALQRRLGGVTSGASSYAQLHFGLRR
ncbi:A-kinase anchor protein 9 isoform X3 [Poeciliopsis prolifica]|uniref:A-kinase anchor protein 9 isoform X3 n=1 Tax=Poeciliopsis prolifica TaxID=188132 RepID=UPI0024134B72|nr:A-kinase anchor protein 9 isoform X3 [Poeciliopsis prolifica]